MPKPNTIESITPLSGAYSCAADFRLNAWLAVATILWLAGKGIIRFNPELSPAANAAILLAPLVPGLLYARSWWRFVAGMDEMQRRIQLQIFLLATTCTLFVSVVLNTLRDSGLNVGSVSIGPAFILMISLWTIGSYLSNRRYK
jgi:hypothetical protein